MSTGRWSNLDLATATLVMTDKISRSTLPPDVDETVHAWSSEGAPDAVILQGTTRRYAIDPTAECVIGMVTDGAMLARRGRERYVVNRGDLVIWDASGRHAGTPMGHDCWAARLIILPLPAVEEIVLDPDLPVQPVAFGAPHVRNRVLAQRFLALHGAMKEPASALMQSVLLHEWFQHLTGGRGQTQGTRRARLDGALRRACQLLSDDPVSNVTLGQLAAVANVSRHRLSRLFRAAYGCPPHQFLLAQRLRLARQWLSSGVSITEAAQRAGFTDQSHFHRHLKKSLGFTPGEYQRLCSNVQDRTRGAR